MSDNPPILPVEADGELVLKTPLSSQRTPLASTSSLFFINFALDLEFIPPEKSL